MSHMLCPNCHDWLWEWIRESAADFLVCRACGCKFTVFNASDHSDHCITVTDIPTIGSPDTMLNLTGEEDKHEL